MKNATYKCENLLLNVETKERFYPKKINELWVSDASFLRKPGFQKTKKLKIFTIMDVYDRYIVGYFFWEKNLGGEKMIELLKKIFTTITIPKIFHSDRGPEFYNTYMKELFLKNNVRQSLSRPYTPTDNAFMERFYRTMKVENRYFEKMENWEIKRNARNWIDIYNNQRYHSSLSTSPQKFSGRKIIPIEI